MFSTDLRKALLLLAFAVGPLVAAFQCFPNLLRGDMRWWKVRAVLDSHLCQAAARAVLALLALAGTLATVAALLWGLLYLLDRALEAAEKHRTAEKVAALGGRLAAGRPRVKLLLQLLCAPFWAAFAIVFFAVWAINWAWITWEDAAWRLAPVGGRARVLMVGMPGAGKTTVLARCSNVTSKMLLVGLLMERGNWEGLALTALCMDPTRDKAFWRRVLQGFLRRCRRGGATGVVLVLDSTELFRSGHLGFLQEELLFLLRQPQARKLVPPPVALLVLANKSDLPGALSPEQVAQALGLFKLDAELCKWRVECSCAASGEGLQAGFLWLEQTLATARRP